MNWTGWLNTEGRPHFENRQVRPISGSVSTTARLIQDCFGQQWFNFQRAAAAEKPAVIVVEGFFDCLKLHRAGVRSVVALMGSALYPSQECLLIERFRHVILMLDGDSAGRHATAEIAFRLRSHCTVQVIHLAPDTQPDQMTSEEIWRVLRTHCAGPIR